MKCGIQKEKNIKLKRVSGVQKYLPTNTPAVLQSPTDHQLKGYRMQVVVQI